MLSNTEVKMELQLEIISHQRHTMPAEQSQFVFKAVGGTIGRSHKNDWLLDDPERIISGQHALIFFENNLFLITDTSTNGLFVNKSQFPLGDKNHIIANGDVFLLGEFSLQASLIATQSSAVFSSSQSTVLQQSPFKSALQLSSQISLPVNSQAEQSTALDANVVIFPHELSQLVDPLETLVTTSHTDSFEAQNLLHETEKINSVLAPIPSIQSYFNLPDAIPENWIEKQSDLLNIDIIDNESDLHCSKLKNIQSNENVNNKKIVGSFDEFKEDYKYTEKNNKPLSKKEHDLSKKNNCDFHNGNKKSHQNVKQDSKITPISLNTENSPNVDDVYQDAINILLKTIGINPEDVSAKKLPEITKNIGLITKSSMAGIMKSMISRAHLKNEFRLSMTTIKSQENNPLKLCINYKQLIHYMLVEPMSGYLDPEQAIKESFSEIQEHQLGVMAGTKSSLSLMFKKLSPEKISSKSDKNRTRGLEIGSKKSRYWDAYTDLYNEINDDDVFNTFLSNEFSRAYERQIEDIRQAISEN